MKTGERKIYFDILRIIAVMLVVFNHSPGYNKTLGLSDSVIKDSIFYLIGTITKINVPIFFMISGALLIPKKEEWGILFKKRVLRILFVIVIVNTIIYIENIFSSIKSGGDFSFIFKEYVSGMVSNSMDGTVPYWYLYAYLAYLLMLPFIRKLCSEITDVDIKMLIIFKLIMSTILPMLNYYSNVLGISILASDSFRIILVTTDSIFYPIMGYYIDSSKKDIRHLINSLAVIFPILYIISFVSIYYGSYGEGGIEYYKTSVVWILAILVFYSIKLCFSKLSLRNNKKIQDFINLYGAATFGVYLIDPLVGRNLFSLYEDCVEVYWSSMTLSIVWSILLLFVGGGITILLKKNRILNKLL